LPRCSINVSGQSLGDAKFCDFVIAELAASGVAPDRLCFEITETAAVRDLSSARTFISRVRELGCHLALDDFGSGMCSFAYLKTLPVDRLKIDGSFVRTVADSPIDRALVNSINAIGHVLGLETVAEFVENDAIRAVLVELGIDYGQGYGLGKPIALEAALEPIAAAAPRQARARSPRA
jgi:EAL domain-containing protein (putative c-di-GMP-specific phosphodiesterase class I)